MEKVNPHRPQWMDAADRSLMGTCRVLTCLLLIVGRLQGRPSFSMHPRASDVLFSSMFIYGLACWICRVSRGRVHVAAYTVADVSFFVMLTAVTRVAYAA